ncbi:hypothetical protein KSI01_03780 [Kurthia sibirica]|nr:EamA family transporter [Kurthia sibirica]GEK32845.1 hypothetical protein KSI01_03780 [Kurthia sibirica]
MDQRGVILALYAGTTFAAYTNVSKILLYKEASLPAVAVIFTIGGLLLVPISFYEGIAWSTKTANWFPLMSMAVFGTSIAYFLVGCASWILRLL